MSPPLPIGAPRAFPARLAAGRSGTVHTPRNSHLVDRALAAWGSVREGGLTLRELARRRRRTVGYISVVVRLGQVLEGLGDEQLAMLRTSHLTFKAAQQTLRFDSRKALPAATRDALRRALRELALGPVPGPRRSDTGGAAGASPATRDRRGRRPTQIPGWDPVAFARDPEAFVEHHLATLAAAHAAVATAVTRAVQSEGVVRALAGAGIGASSIRSVGRATRDAVIAAARAAEAPEARRALRRMEHATRALRELAGLPVVGWSAQPFPAGGLSDRSPVGAGGGRSATRPGPIALPPICVSPDELAAEFED